MAKAETPRATAARRPRATAATEPPLPLLDASSVFRQIAIALLAGCGGGYSRVLTLEEVPAGTCPRGHLEVGESCTVGARDYSVGSTVHADTDRGDIGTTLWFRMPMFDVGLDERRIARGDTGGNHHSLAGVIGTHLRPMILWPKVNRYVLENDAPRRLMG